MRWLGSVAGLLRQLTPNRSVATGRPTHAPGLMIVRGGLSPAYYFFCRVFAKEHNLEVIPDRRMNDRRRLENSTTVDRRHGERRSGVDRLSSQDFIVVRQP